MSPLLIMFWDWIVLGIKIGVCFFFGLVWCHRF